MKLRYLFLLCIVFLSFVKAQDENADCIILEDENSIICKYTHERVSEDKNITIQWIEPDNRISREREMKIPAFHGSVYDYRYINGRSKGEWIFKVIDEQKEYTTTFVIE